VFAGTSEATQNIHFKNRVLDLVDIFVRRQPKSPYLSYFILPLLELSRQNDKAGKQLADKAKGILRTKFVRNKEAPSSLNQDRALKVLLDTHKLARKSPSPDHLTTVSACSLYMARLLVGAGEQSAVVKVYSESLKDFSKRKASRLSPSFFQEFCQRLPAVAWEMRMAFVDAMVESVSAFRKAHAFHFVGAFIGQVDFVSTSLTYHHLI
jgi:DNA polymerase phi